MVVVFSAVRRKPQYSVQAAADAQTSTVTAETPTRDHLPELPMLLCESVTIV